MNTREKLMLTAERLFAERGIQGVSLRQINIEAGQKNASATHYHFGSREALISAILEYRFAILMVRRQEMLDKLESEGRLGDLRGLVEVMVRPLAELVMNDPDGPYYARFLVQIRNDPLVPSTVNVGIEKSLRRTRAMARDILKDMPAAVARHRMAMATSFIINSMAEFVAQRDRLALQNRSFDFAVAVENLIDMVIGGIEAELSPTVQEFGDRNP